MTAFSRPDHAVRAALAIQDGVASFNSSHGGNASAPPIVLKLGFHAGPCIAVTTGDVLDYFGATVNVAARLENQCHGGEVIVSEDVARDAETAAALAIGRRSKKRRRCAASARRFGLFESRAAAKIRQQGPEFGRLTIGVVGEQDKPRSPSYV